MEGLEIQGSPESNVWSQHRIGYFSRMSGISLRINFTGNITE